MYVLNARCVFANCVGLPDGYASALAASAVNARGLDALALDACDLDACFPRATRRRADALVLPECRADALGVPESAVEIVFLVARSAFVLAPVRR